MTATPTTPAAVLQLPLRVARKYAARARVQGLDESDLESAGNLALAKALAAFDPAKAPQGGAGLGAFCAQRVVWAVRNLVWPGPHEVGERLRRTRTVSMDRPMPGGQALRDLIGGPCPLLAAADLADEVEASVAGPELARTPRQRLILGLLLSGLTMAAAARELGLSRERVRQVLAQVAGRARARRRREETTKGDGNV